MTYEDYNIAIPYNNTSGQYKTLCPECSTNRRKRNDKCLSVNLDDGVWNCHHCGYKGTLNKKVKTQILDLLLDEQIIAKVKKIHVAGCGYVTYYYNKFGVSLINASKEDGQITLRYKR